jgi:hypothetical protein
MYLLIVYYALAGGEIPVMQDFQTLDQCQAIQEKLANDNTSSFQLHERVGECIKL